MRERQQLLCIEDKSKKHRSGVSSSRSSSVTAPRFSSLDDVLSQAVVWKKRLFDVATDPIKETHISATEHVVTYLQNKLHEMNLHKYQETDLVYDASDVPDLE
jgi:hypothetical protein